MTMYQERTRFQPYQHHRITHELLGRRGRQSFHIIAATLKEE